MIKAILWDMDGTLLNFLISEKNAVKKGFEYFGLGECSDENVRLYSEINLRHWKMLEKGLITKPEVKAGRYREFFKRLGITSVTPEEFTAVYEKNLPETVEYIENAKEIVESLRGRYKQYIVTNGTLSVQVKKIEKSGLKELIDGAFISDEIGYEKPSKEFFSFVLSNIIPCERDEVLIVGDSLTSDMKGGNISGIKCCWYNPEKLENNTSLKIDYEINKLNEIYEILK